VTDIAQLVARVGGQRNATIIVAAGGAGAVWFLGRRKAAKSQTAPVNIMAQGYADTAEDPTAIYTGYDQLQQEIDSLREQPGATNPNPVPVPTSPGSPGPVAPTPQQIADHDTWGTPLPSYAPTPAQMLGPAPGWTGGPPTYNGAPTYSGGDGSLSRVPFRHG